MRPYAIGRTDAVADVHRPARMTAIAVRPDGTDEEVRFVGLLGSAAYRQSAFAIPVIGGRADEVVSRVGGSVANHTGRAVRNVIETLPRDVLFELGVDELAQLVEEIVGLQERRIVRVFDVTEPVGPWTTVFVYVPASRFTAAASGAGRCARRRALRRRDPRPRDVRRNQFARPHLDDRARRPVRRSSPLVERIDDMSRTWGERAREALVDVLGEVEGHRVWSVVGPIGTRRLRGACPSERAVGDLINVEAMLSGHDEVSTSFGRSIDAVDGAWRFRVFLRDRAATIAELVPILEHLGLPPVDERPYGVRRRARHRLSRRHRCRDGSADDLRRSARRGAAGVRRADAGRRRSRWAQPAGAVGRTRPSTDRRAAHLQPLPPPGDVPVQRRVRQLPRSFGIQRSRGGSPRCSMRSSTRASASTRLLEVPVSRSNGHACSNNSTRFRHSTTTGSVGHS